MLPIKHNKEPLGKGLKVHSTTFSRQHLGKEIEKHLPELKKAKGDGTILLEDKGIFWQSRTMIRVGRQPEVSTAGQRKNGSIPRMLGTK